MDDYQLNISVTDNSMASNYYNDEVINDEVLDAENAKKQKDVRDALERLLEAKRVKEETDFI
jgi:hypothetical protein